jgi:hypothetical protein
MSRPMINLSGQTFGKLTVIRYHGRRGAKGSHAWVCRCECGSEKVIQGRAMNGGGTVSCGCFAKSRIANANTKHGLHTRANRHPLFDVWRSMRRRCYNRKTHNWHLYGARGIAVCERWRKSFAAFVEDMGPRPSGGYTIERRDNNGNYTPENCYWATMKTQSNNRRNNRAFEHGGRTLTLSQWAEVARIKNATISERLKRGWPFAKAITVKPDTRYHAKAHA